MGQVIEFGQRRPSGRQDRSKPAARAVPWPLSPVDYIQQVVEPSFAAWRSLVAGYAGFWFAPFGIVVKVAERPPRHSTRARVNSGR